MSSSSSAQYETDEDAIFRRSLEEALRAEEPQGLGPRGGVTPRYEIQDLSHTHEAVMNWMIANPQRKMSECAAHFGYSQPWLSVLVHSDLFQARLKEKQDQLFNVLAGDITEKLGTLADISVTKLTEQAADSNDPKFQLEAAKLALNSLGFGKPTAPASQTNVQQNNIYVASPADLSAARERMQQVGQVSPAMLPVPGDAPSQPEPPEPLTLENGAGDGAKGA